MHAALALLVAFSLEATASSSKLGPYVLNPIDDSALLLLDACPRVAKWQIPDPGVASAIADFRTGCPDSQVVLQVTLSAVSRFSLAETPDLKASDVWGSMNALLSEYSVFPANVDWLEGPYELYQLPDWGTDTEAADWVAEFWSALADRMNAAGWRPLIGSIPATYSSTALPFTENPFKKVADAMRGKDYSWGWSYHAYATTTDASDASDSVLHYRTIRDECDLAGEPILLSEAGLRNSIGKGWQQMGIPAADYLAWLEWLDGRAQEDSEVVGAIIFQIGDHEARGSYELGPLASDLADHLVAAAAPDAGPGSEWDGGGSTGSGGFGNRVPEGYYQPLPRSGCGCSQIGGEAMVICFAFFLRGTRKRDAASA
jgi:hypothetical protein